MKDYCNKGKSFRKRKHPFGKERLDTEMKTVGEYGLKNKREAWRVQYALAKIRTAARHLLTLDENDEPRIFQGDMLLRRMCRLRLLSETEDQLGYALNLTTMKNHRAADAEKFRNWERSVVRHGCWGDEPSAFKSRLEESYVAATTNTGWFLTGRRRGPSRVNNSCHVRTQVATENRSRRKRSSQSWKHISEVSLKQWQLQTACRLNSSMILCSKSTSQVQNRSLSRRRDEASAARHAADAEHSAAEHAQQREQPRLKVDRGSSEGRWRPECSPSSSSRSSAVVCTSWWVESTKSPDILSTRSRSRRGAGRQATLQPMLPPPYTTTVSNPHTNVNHARTSWRSGIPIILPGWGYHTGGSRSIPTVHPCPLRRGGCG